MPENGPILDAAVADVDACAQIVEAKVGALYSWAFGEEETVRAEETPNSAVGRLQTAHKTLLMVVNKLDDMLEATGRLERPADEHQK